MDIPLLFTQSYVNGHSSRREPFPQIMKIKTDWKEWPPSLEGSGEEIDF